MQGLWKNNRKHFIKDKRAFLSNYKYHAKDNLIKKGVVQFEDDQIPVQKIYKEFKINIVKVYLITLCSNLNEINSREAYILDNRFYDNLTNELINDKRYRVSSYLYRRKLEKPIVKNKLSLVVFFRKIRKKRISSDRVYNRAKPFWKNLYYYDKKPYQIIANRKDRRRSKEFCIKKDWDTIVKTHSTSKSILRDIY